MSRREDEEGIRVLPGYKEADYPYIPLKMTAQISMGQVESQMAGSISAFTQADIMWVKTLHGSTWQTIYDGAIKTPAVIPVGVSWELHILVSSTNITGGYVVGVSYKIGTLTDFISDRKVIGGAYWEKEFAFPGSRNKSLFASLPAAGVALDHIKFWVSDFYTTSQPPQADW